MAKLFVNGSLKTWRITKFGEQTRIKTMPLLTTTSPGISGQYQKTMTNSPVNRFRKKLRGYAKGSGPIQPLKKSTKGTFTASAKAAGQGVQGFASKVLSAPKGKYSPLQRKRANFAKNAAKWHH